MTTANQPIKPEACDTDFEGDAVLINFYTDDCPPDAIDSTFLICCTDRGCDWAVLCADVNNPNPAGIGQDVTPPSLVQIEDTWYYTWWPKGLQDDSVDQTDPGLHIHLSCNYDQTGIRITAESFVFILEQLTDPLIIARFCTWVFENCFETDRFMQWVCDTIINHCMPDAVWTEAFCQWFVDFVLTDPTCRDALITWFITFPGLVPIWCQTMVQCFGRQTIIDEVCLVIVDCLQDPDLRNFLCGVMKDCLENEDFLKDKICDIVKNYCNTVDVWDSTIDPDPVGSPTVNTYLIDTSSGCITAVCVNGIWTCVPTPTYVPVITDGIVQCPVPFPVIYKTIEYANAAALAAALTIEYGCTVTYRPADCTMCFPWECDNPPPAVHVTTPPAAPTYVPVITDTVYQCPIPFPVIYNTVLYNDATALAAALTLQYGCPVSFRASDCNMCFPPSCPFVPPQVDVTTPPVPVPSYAPVITDAIFQCPVPFPVIYNTILYNDSASLAAALTTQYGCSVTYRPSPDCDMCFPPACVSPPTQVDVTTPPPPPPCDPNPTLSDIGGFPDSGGLCIRNRNVPGGAAPSLLIYFDASNLLCQGLQACFNIPFILNTASGWDFQMDIITFDPGQQLSVVLGTGGSPFPLASFVNPTSGVFCANIPTNYGITGPRWIGLHVYSLDPVPPMPGQVCLIATSATVT